MILDRGDLGEVAFDPGEVAKDSTPGEVARRQKEEVAINNWIVNKLDAWIWRWPQLSTL